MNLGKFDCSTGVINILYSDTIKNISVRTSTIKDILLIDKLQKENSYFDDINESDVQLFSKGAWEKI